MAGVVNAVSVSFGAPSSFGAVTPAVMPAASSPAVATAALIRNPQIIQDPMAGYITQYVNLSNGVVVSQAPSAKAVAYLRQGLSADGMPQQTNLPEPVATTA
jgi:hypothetical protein